ncbi:head maturation protease, ClpP-related [Flavobacterium sp. RS13.1]|uniref:head maturation protease, ClpP-related n=1 Tax=Flavobacterium sp. RS13.1 TaxID=3400345 RepID=UPI003AAD888C
MNEILMYGEIGTDITDVQFNKELNLFKGQDVLIRANSPGGEVFAGLTMYNSIKEHGQCDVQIDGLAASMMTVIMLAARKISASKNALIMIHNPDFSGQLSSNREKKDAEILSKVKDIAVNSYSERTGLSPDEISEMLNQETWMTAQEALEKGFIDEITDDVLVRTPVANMKNKKPKAIYMTFKKEAPKMESLCKILGLSETSDTEIVLKAISSLKNKLVSKEAELNRIKNQIKSDQTAEAKNIIALAISKGVISKNLERIQLLAFENDFKKTKEDLLAEINEKVGSNVQLTNHNLIKEVILGSKNKQKETIAEKPRIEWTLQDYRKHAPKELENDKELYQKLVKEEYKQ